MTAEEEAALMSEVEPHLKRLVYEKDHWDEVGTGNCFHFQLNSFLQRIQINSGTI